VLEEEWFGGHWPSAATLKLSINHLELLTALGALKRWGPRLRGRKWILRCDNEVTVRAFNAGSARDPALAYLVRECYDCMMRNSFLVSLQHFPGVVNVLADLPSRLRFADFHAAYDRSDLSKRFGQARRVAVEPEFFSPWISECLRLKAEQAEWQARVADSSSVLWMARRAAKARRSRKRC